MLFVSFPNNIS